MKKFTLISLLFLFALTAFTGITSADETTAGLPVADLTALAVYAPDSAPFFAAVRTDAAFIEEIDGLWSSMLDKFPALMIPERVAVRELLNTVVFEATQGSMTFDASVRPWLGDSVAVYIPSLDTITRGADFPLVVAVAITDQEAADGFLTGVLGEMLEYGVFEVTELDDGSTFYQASSFFPASILVTADVLFIGPFDKTFAEIVLPGADRRKLSQAESFRKAMDALPEDAYSVVAYLDLEEIMNNLGPFLAMGMPPELQGIIDPYQIADLLGQQAAGLTMLDRSVVLDYAHTGALGEVESRPLDTEFLRHVPADTAILLHNNGLADNIYSLLELLDKMDEFLTTAGALPLEDAGPFSNFRFGQLGTFARLAFEGTTHLDFDVTLAWMNGDYALFLSLPPGGEDALRSRLGFGMEGGFALETDNPGATADYVSALAEIALDSFATATYEDGLVTVPLGDLFSLPEVANISIGSNDRVLAAGSSASVAFALSPTEDAITATPTFTYAQDLFLPDAGFLLYVDLAPVRAAFEALVEANPDAMGRWQAATLRSALQVLDTVSMTAFYSEAGGTIRLALTLGE